MAELLKSRNMPFTRGSPIDGQLLVGPFGLTLWQLGEGPKPLESSRPTT